MLQPFQYRQDMCAIKDTLGETHSPASSDHYSHLKFDLFSEILKSGDGRQDCGSAWWINILSIALDDLKTWSEISWWKLHSSHLHIRTYMQFWQIGHGGFYQKLRHTTKNE